MSFKPTWSYGQSRMMNIGKTQSPEWSYGFSIIFCEFGDGLIRRSSWVKYFVSRSRNR